jgi:hypothetical protein
MTKCFSEVKNIQLVLDVFGNSWKGWWSWRRWLLKVYINKFWYICSIVCILKTSRRDFRCRFSIKVCVIRDIDNRKDFGNSSKIYCTVISMNGVPMMMVWLICFVTTKNVLREMPLLKTEAWVLPAICNFELLEAESFSEIFYKNCFGTSLNLHLYWIMQ